MTRLSRDRVIRDPGREQKKEGHMIRDMTEGTGRP